MSIFSGMSVSELKEYAKEKNIKGIYMYKKQELISLLENLENDEVVKAGKEKNQTKVKNENKKTVKSEKPNSEKVKSEKAKPEKTKSKEAKSEEKKSEREKAEKERVERKKAEKERVEIEKSKKEKSEREKAEKEKAEKEKAEREKVEKERAEREKVEKERAEKEKAEIERAEKEKVEREKVEREKVEKERVDEEKFETDRLDEKKSNEVKSEEVKSEEVKSEEVKSNEVKSEKAEPEKAATGNAIDSDGNTKRPDFNKTYIPHRKIQETNRRPVYDDKRQSQHTQTRQVNQQHYQDGNTQSKPEYQVKQENVQTSRIDYSDLSRLIMQPGVPMPPEVEQMDSKETKEGILEIMSDGYGFIRCDNFLPGENDVYVAPIQIRKLNLKTGDIIVGNTRIKNQNEKFSALLYIKSINGFNPMEVLKRPKFEELTPVFPNERIRLEAPGSGISMRMVDLVSPIGKGQRGMIVSQPKTGKTTLLKQMAKSIIKNHPEMHMIILLIDERPEEVTDIKESIEGKSVEVIYSTFDELPENHKRVSEMVIERAKRLVEHKKDVIILLDSITRLARAYNLTVQASGRTLSGGLDPAALHMPKRFFGAARNMREGGSLTILATALVDTGSRMDDVVYEEFKGTGNMELTLDRGLSEKRIFPAIDLPKSSTRRDDLLFEKWEIEANFLMRRAFNSLKSDDSVERILQLFMQTKNNREFSELIKKTKIIF